jgi:hypothetical protein
LAILLVPFFSCAPDLFYSGTSGILEDEYARKSVPEMFLASLEVIVGDSPPTSGDIVPEFFRETSDYELGVIGATTVRIRAAVANPDRATVTVNGIKLLAPDWMSVSITIPAEGVVPISIIVEDLDNEASTFPYTVVVKSFLSSTDPNERKLTGLTVASGEGLPEYERELDDIFSMGVAGTFEDTVDTEISSLIIAPVATDALRMYLNGIRIENGDSGTVPLRVGENVIRIQVVGHDLASYFYTLNIERLAPAMYGLLINEWAATYTKDICEDFIELKNYGTQDVYLDRDFRIFIGPTPISLISWGTGVNPGSYASVATANSGQGVRVAPGEIVLVVKNGITRQYIELFQDSPGFRPNTKFIRSSESKLIGVRKRLHENQAYLQWGEDYQWSFTPDVEIMTQAGSTMTVSQLRGDFRFGIDCTTDVTKWINGNLNSRTPGKMHGE